MYNLVVKKSRSYISLIDMDFTDFYDLFQHIKELLLEEEYRLYVKNRDTFSLESNNQIITITHYGNN